MTIDDPHASQHHEHELQAAVSHGCQLANLEEGRLLSTALHLVDEEVKLPPRPRSTAFLDGLRGLAALFVFNHHFIGPFYPVDQFERGFGEEGEFYYLANAPFLRVVYTGGAAAVAIFFVLSGYVLSKSPLSLIRDKKHTTCLVNLVSAVIRRPLRLYLPPLVTALAFAFLMHAPFGIVPPTDWPKPQSNIFAEIVSWVRESVDYFNPFQRHGFHTRGWYPYNVIVWTIPIELKGSMLIYAVAGIYTFTWRWRLSSLLALAVACVVLFQKGEWTMGCFLAGMILSFLDAYSLDKPLLDGRLSKRAQNILWSSLFVVGFYLLCQPAHDGHPESSLNTPGWHYLSRMTPSTYDAANYYRYWHSWGAIMLVYALLRLPWIQRFLDCRSMRYLGQVSFMLYLLHWPAGAVVGNRIARALGRTANENYSWFNDRLWIPDIGPVGFSTRFLVAYGLYLPFCLFISDIGTRLVDQPTVRLGKALTTKLGIEKLVRNKIGG